MLLLTRSALMAALAGGLFLAAPSASFAQSHGSAGANDREGIIRITDASSGAFGAQAGTMQRGSIQQARFGHGHHATGQCNTCPNGQCGNGQCGHGQCQTSAGGHGGCPSGVCGHGYGYCGNGYCGYGYGHHDHLRDKLHTIFGSHGTVSPGHGWEPPVKHPLYRKPVAYNNAWSAAWNCQPSSAPVQKYPHVYTPTDTTQLGYYYQRVPKWWPNPSMIPGPPNPTEWHHRGCPYPNCFRGKQHPIFSGDTNITVGAAGCPYGSGCPHCQAGVPTASSDVATTPTVEGPATIDTPVVESPQTDGGMMDDGTMLDQHIVPPTVMPLEEPAPLVTDPNVAPLPQE